MKKKERLNGREREEEDDKGDVPPLIVLAGFATGGRGAGLGMGVHGPWF